MTELSIMLISGTLSDGAIVTITANPNQQKLEYQVAGMPTSNGRKRANESSVKHGLHGASPDDIDDIDAMED